MEREKKNDKYPIIDDAKMFFCICIICLHTDGLSFLPAAKEKIIVQSCGSILFRSIWIFLIKETRK